MTARGKWATAPFRAWDTEGLGAGARHRCVALVDDQGARQVDGAGLSSRKVLGALWRGLQKHPDELHVAFAFGYDVQMLLRDLPRPVATTLWTDGRVRWGPYRIGYEPRRSFTLYRRTDAGWVGGRVWDTFGFFQSSLVVALQRYGLDGSPAFREVAAMKQRRATFHRRDLARITAYAVLECQLLVALMDQVRAAAVAADLPLPRWDGAGAVASALLRRQSAQTYLPRGPTPRRGDPWPAPVREGARYAYFGGRIEVGQVGHHAGPIHRYDVRSAYPAILATLPAGEGSWEQVGPEPDRAGDGPTLRYVRWSFRPGARWYPFPWRARDGAVLYPPAGEGWYWGPEVEAARDAFYFGQLRGSLEIEATWRYYPHDPAARPWAWIEQQYAHRAKLKAAGDGAEKILKLGMNSLYGKLAQSLGGTVDQAPRWHCLEWAGYITAAIRARLFRAALAAGPGAVALATDAIFSTRRIGALAGDVGPGLGQWEHTAARSGTWVQSGVYWTGDADAEAAYHRGFSPAVLHRADVVRAWRQGRESLAVPETRFSALGASVGSASQWARRGQWITTDRVLTLVPFAGQKRLVPLATRPRSLAAGLVWTAPRVPLSIEGHDPAHPHRSAPVALPWFPDGLAPPDTAAATEYSPLED